MIISKTLSKNATVKINSKDGKLEFEKQNSKSKSKSSVT